MYQDLDDPIEVIAVFADHQLRPLRFKWRGNVHKISRITGSWKKLEGECVVRFFAVVDDQTNVFQLTYNERLTDWTLSKVWVE